MHALEHTSQKQYGFHINFIIASTCKPRINHNYMITQHAKSFIKFLIPNTCFYHINIQISNKATRTPSIRLLTSHGRMDQDENNICMSVTRSCLAILNPMIIYLMVKALDSQESRVFTLSLTKHYHASSKHRFFIINSLNYK